MLGIRLINQRFPRIFLTSILESPIINKVYHKHKKNQEDMQAEVIQLPTPQAYYLQGCSYMLTREFFKHYTQLYPKTFLYWEELNLLWYVYRAGLKTKYADTSPIVHKVAISTKRLVENKNLKSKKKKLVMDGVKRSLPLYFSSYKTILRKYN